MRAVRFFTALGFLTTPLPPVLIRAVFFWPGLSFFAVFLAPVLPVVRSLTRSARVLALNLAMACLVMAMSRQQALCTCSERATGLTTEYCEGT